MLPATDLNLFIVVQEEHWLYVREELIAGKMRSHWIWFVFPQYRGLGTSYMSRRFAIPSRAEAIAYLDHPILGSRLRECCQILLGLPSSSAFEVFGTPDDFKLRSCMTLFNQVSGPERLFAAVLERFYGGQTDARTIELIDCFEGGRNVD